MRLNIIKRELIYIDDKDETDRIAKYSFKGEKISIVFQNGNKEFLYGRSRVRVVKTAITSDKAFNVFNYLKELANTVGLKTEEGENLLSKSYQNIEHISNDSVLSSYLNGSISNVKNNSVNLDFFPFGFNLSQREAVKTAFSCNLSVIEGPPGTGKTQTILNIIANAVLNGKTVAVVSSNNAATRNVYEKLEKNGIEFIAALLGNSQNKKEFVESQKVIPDLSKFNLSENETQHFLEKSKSLLAQICENLEKKNEMALLRLQRENIETEYQHFNEIHKNKIEETINFKSKITANKLLKFWVELEALASKQKKIGWIKRLLFRLKYGIKDKLLFTNAIDRIIYNIQLKYYPVKIRELSARIEFLGNSLSEFSFDTKMREYTQISLELLKAELYKKYNKQKRQSYTISELRSKSNEFIQDYPVVLSTTYSLRQSLSEKIAYDYVIIDESSQVDLATGALALSCAKRAVIVGDLKQLPNVVDRDIQEKTDMVFNAYKLPKPFYNNQLIIHSEYTDMRQPLIVYKTTMGNHARDRMNQRQIDIIKEEIIPKEKLENVDLGIVTPYRNQTNALQQNFQGTWIKADTVDKFQGRENEVIILSTVDNEISDFTDNPNRLNVAVSRAIEQLIVVVNGNNNEKDNNIADLIKYIEYNNFSIVESELNSIFDLLYKGYEDERAKFIRKSGKVSSFDSENLMFGLIKRVLSEDKFLKFDVLMHFPLRQLIKDLSKLDEQEIKYASNPFTHIDFLIYNKLGKSPVLGIEVDGFEFHKEGTKQSERDKMKERILTKYNFPILRFRTNESNEVERLTGKLHELLNADKNGNKN